MIKEKIRKEVYMISSDSYDDIMNVMTFFSVDGILFETEKYTISDDNTEEWNEEKGYISLDQGKKETIMWRSCKN